MKLTSLLKIRSLMTLCLTVLALPSFVNAQPISKEDWKYYREWNNTLEQKVKEVNKLSQQVTNIEAQMKDLSKSSTTYRSLSKEVGSIRSQIASLNASNSAYRAAGYAALKPKPPPQPAGVWKENSLGTGAPDDPRNNVYRGQIVPEEVDQAVTSKPVAVKAEKKPSVEKIGPTNQAGRDALEASQKMEEDASKIAKNEKLLEKIFPGEFKTPKGDIHGDAFGGILRTSEQKRIYFLNKLHFLTRDLSIFPNSKKVIAEFQEHNKAWLTNYSKVLAAIQMAEDSIPTGLVQSKLTAVQALDKVNDLDASEQMKLLKKRLSSIGTKALAGLGILGVGLSAANASAGESPSAEGSAKSFQYRGTVPVVEAQR